MKNILWHAVETIALVMAMYWFSVGFLVSY